MMDKNDDERYQKIFFSIRMLKFHKFITEVQFKNMIIKLERLIHKEQNMNAEEISNYMNKIW